MQNKSSILIILAVAGWMALGGCELFQPREEANQEEALARVKDQFLYPDEIEDLGLQNASSADSAKIVSEYIENWVRHQLKLEYAYENLPPEKLDIEQQIQDYRESLVIYIYETEYLKQNLDTAITMAQMKDFYASNQEKFKLANDLVRMVFLKLPKGAPKLDSLRIWLENYDEESKYRVQQYAYANALGYNLNDSMWFDRMSIRMDISEKMANSYDLSRSQVVEVQDSSFIIFARTNDFKINESTAPFSYVEDEVERMIINKRKLKLKQDFSENIITNATEQNLFEIYK